MLYEFAPSQYCMLLLSLLPKEHVRYLLRKPFESSRFRTIQQVAMIS